MTPVQNIDELLGENLADELGLGEDLDGQDLYAGYIPGRTIEYMPQVQLGDGLAGPENEQHLVIFRDNRVIAADDLGRQGPFLLRQGAVARHRAGRTFPLNYQFGPAALDEHLYERAPEQDARVPSPLDPGQSPSWHAGVMPPEVLPNTYTVPYTYSPDVGYSNDGSF